MCCLLVIAGARIVPKHLEKNMSKRTEDLSLSQKRFQKTGCALACGVLMLANQFVSVAMAGDILCNHPSDLNCDQIVDGQDLAIVLGSWGESGNVNDLDGDCSVGGSDLAMVLGSWGPVPSIQEIQDVTFNNSAMSFCMGTDSLQAVADGQISFDPMTYEQYGYVNITYAGGGYVGLEYSSGSVVMMCGETKMILDTSDEDTLQVNGELVPVAAVLTGLQGDYETHGTNVAAWTDESKMVGTQIIINGDVNIRDNVIIIQNNPVPPAGGTAGPGLMCKMACIAAAAQIAMMMTAVCALGCVGVGAITIGTAVIPCAVLASILCSGLVFAGSTAAYELCLSYWGG